MNATVKNGLSTKAVESTLTTRAASAASLANCQGLLIAEVTLEGESSWEYVSKEDAHLFEGVNAGLNGLLVILKDIIDVQKDGRNAGMSNALYEHEMCNVISSLKADWAGSESVLSFGVLKHQMMQIARGYASKSAQHRNDAVAFNAYRKMSIDLTDSKVVRKMLQLCGKLRSISANTFEYLEGGRIRIAYYL